MLILGGTGRVGSSTASALLRKCPGAEIILASRSTKSYEAAVKKRPELAKAEVNSLHYVDGMNRVKTLTHEDKRSGFTAFAFSGCMLGGVHQKSQQHSNMTKSSAVPCRGH